MTQIRTEPSVASVSTADFLCFDSIVIEIKALSGLAPEHTAQVLNYLKASELELGLLINFGTPRVQIKRLILNQKIPTVDPDNADKNY